MSTTRTTNTYGYCRISTAKQNIERQERNIKAAYPDAIILKEQYTGTKTEGRKELDKLLRIVKPGDCIVFDSVSRMSRNAQEGYELYKRLYDNGISLVFLKEHHIDTATYKKAMDTGIQLTGTNVDYILEGVNKYLLALAREQIILAFAQAQKEVDDLKQRTREGLLTAKLAGKRVGNKKGEEGYVEKLTTKKSEALKKLIVKYSREFEGKNKDDEVISIINGMDKIVYGTKTIMEEDAETGKKKQKEIELELKPHDGLTKTGNTKNRYINRGTYYKYKRELYNKYYEEVEV